MARVRVVEEPSDPHHPHVPVRVRMWARGGAVPPAPGSPMMEVESERARLGGGWTRTLGVDGRAGLGDGWVAVGGRSFR